MAPEIARRAYEVETQALFHTIALYMDIFLPRGFDLGVWQVEGDDTLTPKILGRDEGLRDMLLRLPVRTKGEDEPFFADREEMIALLERVRPFIGQKELKRLRLRTLRFARLQRLRMMLDVEAATS